MLAPTAAEDLGETVADSRLGSAGYGIVNADGELWRVQRKAGLSFLNNKNLQVLTDVALPQYLRQSIRHLTEQSAASHQVDLQGVFHEITSQLMGKMAYNVCFSHPHLLQKKI